MARGKEHTAEQIVNLLRQVEVGVANGKTLPQAWEEAEIVEQTYYRGRREFGGLKVDQARRLKELELESAKLKRLIANLSLEKLVLKDIAEGNSHPLQHHPSTLFARPPIARSTDVATRKQTGYGEVESKVRFPLPHTLDGGETSTNSLR